MRRLLALTFGLVCASFLFVMSEWFFGKWIKDHGVLIKRNPDLNTESEAYFREHPPLSGIFPPPPPHLPLAQQYKGPSYPPVGINNIDSRTIPENCTKQGIFLVDCREIRKTKDGKFMWDVTYHVNGFHRRIVPGQESKRSDKYMVALGDSVVYGIGVPEEGTLSYFLSLKFPEFKHYNFGRPSHYPPQIMESMRQLDPTEISETEGVVLYFIEYYNLQRISGIMRELALWASKKPVYFQDDTGALRSEGNFDTEKPVLVLLSKIVTKFNTLRYFNFNPTPDDQDIKLFARIIDETRKALRLRGAKHFFVIVGPSQKFEIPKYRLFKEFESKNISYIDLTKWNQQTFVPGLVRIPYDFHPTAIRNQVLIEHLSKVIRSELTKNGFLRTH